MECKQSTLKKRAATYHSLGCKQCEVGNWQKAIEYLNKSIEANSKYVLSYLVRAYAYYTMGNYSSALKDCEYILNLTPDYPPILEMKFDIQKRLLAVPK